jgi:signal transduction histidine kinase
MIHVNDDGRGFDPEDRLAEDGDRGFGLFSIRERVQHLGGRVEIDSSPGAGTRVTLAMPGRTDG